MKIRRPQLWFLKIGPCNDYGDGADADDDHRPRNRGGKGAIAPSLFRVGGKQCCLPPLFILMHK